MDYTSTYIHFFNLNLSALEMVYLYTVVMNPSFFEPLFSHLFFLFLQVNNLLFSIKLLLNEHAHILAIRTNS